MSKLVALRIPDDLFVELEKAKGAEGMNLSQIIISVLRETFGAESPKPAKMIIEEKPSSRPVEIPKAIKREVEKPAKVGRLAPCPRCDGPTVNWGPMRRCQKCGQNWPLD